jgi:hypothetical protein
VIKWQRRRVVKNHIVKVSTKTSRFGRNIKMEKLRENGVQDAEQELC